MPFDVGQVRRELVAPVERQSVEVDRIFQTLVLPTWETELHGFPQTLYSHMMGIFAHIDIVSAHWRGDASTRGQTERMIDFMDQFIKPNREANAVAVQIWRHKLMHTGQPRSLLEKRTGKHYRWLLHWSHHLPRDQHFTFAETADSRILNLALAYLLEDVRTGTETYLTRLAADTDLQTKYAAVQAEISSYEVRIYW